MVIYIPIHADTINIIFSGEIIGEEQMGGYMNVVANNIPGMFSQRQLGITNTNKAKTTEKLSSGYKINRAADDAAGLTISEKMRRQIRGLNQGTENIQDGVSYCQVADGALEEVQEMLQRMNELSVKSANDTNTEDDRKAIDKEVQQLKTEIERIFTDTEFNTRKIWTDDVVIKEGTQIGTEEIVGVKLYGYANSYRINDNNNSSKPNGRSMYMNATEDGIKINWTGLDGNHYESKMIPWDSDITGEHKFSLAENIDYELYPNCLGIDLEIKYSVADGATLDDVVDLLDGNCLGSNIVYVGVNNTLYFENGTSTSSDFINSTTSQNLLYYEGISLDRDNGDFLVASNNNCTVNGAKSGDYSEGIEFDYTFHDGQTATAKMTSVAFVNGDAGYRNVNSIQELVDWLNENADEGYNEITITFETNVSSAIPYADMDNMTNSPKTHIMRSDLSTGFNKNDADSLVNHLGEIKGLKSSIAPNTAYTILSVSEKEKKVMVPVYEGEEVANQNLIIQAGSEPEDEIEITYENLRLKKLGLRRTNVLTEESSKQAIDEVKNALSIVSEQRSLFGAYQNRLEHAINQNKNTAENTQAAESLIRDADMADEMVKYSKENILQQVGQSMLAQSNQSRQGILTLLQ